MVQIRPSHCISRGRHTPGTLPCLSDSTTCWLHAEQLSREKKATRGSEEHRISTKALASAPSSHSSQISQLSER